jgi:predicted amidohydrolase YtcJ
VNRLAPLLLACLTLHASDTILIHGHIYTGNPKTPWAQALAITGDRLDAVGSEADVQKHRQPATKVIDLKGSTIIPGIIDSHVHMWQGGQSLRGFTINANNESQLIDTLKTYSATHPAGNARNAWLIGKGSFAPGSGLGPSHELLDRAVPDRPVVAHSGDEHSIWVNAKALELAGITGQPVANPAEERGVVRDAGGHATGLLKEAAMDLVFRVQPPLSMEDRLDIARTAQEFLNRNGITSAINATGDLSEIEIYAALRDKGQLTVRTRTAFGSLGHKNVLTPEFLAELEKTRKLYNDDWVSANLVKFFMDGVIEGHTAAMLLPYADKPDQKGATVYTPDEFLKIITELDKRGLQIMTHAIGDAAVRMTLDAYENLEKVNGKRDRRLRIEHMETIDPADIPRFGQLSVIPSMMPLHCCSGNTLFIGPERLPHGFLWKSMEEGSNNSLILNSDWPAGTQNPFRGIQQAVLREMRRRQNTGTAPAYYLPEQRLTVEQALAGYTRNGAFAGFTEKKTGTLEAGKKADLAVLSQDIFSVAPEEIGKTTVKMTMVGGRVVFGTVD